MRLVRGAIVVASMAAIPALAPDLPIKSPVAIPAPFSWTVCYVGGHLGGAFSQDTGTGVLGNSHDHNASGFVGGGQVGCDYEFAPRWVLGVEGRAAWTSLKETDASFVTNLVTGVMRSSQFTSSNDFLASTTARLGYRFVCSSLF